MHRRYPLLVLLSLFVVAVTAWNCTMKLRYSGMPFALKPVTMHAARIVGLHNMPLPAGLNEGDKIEFAQQTPATRMTLFAMVADANIEPGHTIPLVVTHTDGRYTQIAVAAQALRTVPALRISIYLGFAWFVMVCVIALITLWRGRNPAAWGIAAWAIAFLCGGAFAQTPAFGELALGFGLASQLFFLLSRVGFFIMADVVAAPALDPRARRKLRYAFGLSLALGYAYELSFTLLLVFGAVLIRQIISVIWVLPYAIATSMLLIAYRGAAPETRPRLRWMFWSSTLFVFGIFLSNVSLFGYPNSYLVELLAYIIAFAGLLYALLRHRVVDMSFLINRAIVYSSALTVIVSIFILLESFLEKIALPEGASVALELSVPLVIGFSLEMIRKRLEMIGERLFFHRKFEDQAALQAYARQCTYIENSDHLLDQTLRELSMRSGAPTVGFYWREHDDGYRQLGEAGIQRYPERADVDDRAMVALRAERKSTDLEGLGSAFGENGLLIPIIVRGELMGAVAMAHRPGEHYSPDERELFDHVVHEAGSALHALHARENARLVNAVADGSLSGTELVDRARALASTS